MLFKRMVEEDPRERELRKEIVRVLKLLKAFDRLIEEEVKAHFKDFAKQQRKTVLQILIISDDYLNRLRNAEVVRCYNCLNQFTKSEHICPNCGTSIEWLMP